MIWTCVYMLESGDIMKTGLTIFWNDLLHTKVNTSMWYCRMENVRFLTDETPYQKFCHLMNWNSKSCAKIINQKWFQLIRSLNHWTNYLFSRTSELINPFYYDVFMKSLMNDRLSKVFSSVWKFKLRFIGLLLFRM